MAPKPLSHQIAHKESEKYSTDMVYRMLEVKITEILENENVEISDENREEVDSALEVLSTLITFAKGK